MGLLGATSVPFAADKGEAKIPVSAYLLAGTRIRPWTQPVSPGLHFSLSSMAGVGLLVGFAVIPFADKIPVSTVESKTPATTNGLARKVNTVDKRDAATLE